MKFKPTGKTGGLLVELGRATAIHEPISVNDRKAEPIIPTMNAIPVLYIEDNERDRALVQHVAELAGTRLKIRCVGGVPEAVDYMRGQGQFNNRVDHPLPVFILLDFHLDNQTGLEFLCWLRTRPEFESLPVCIYTDADFVEPIASSYSAGADAFMLKAGSLTRLQAILRALEFCAASSPPSFKSLAGLPEHRTAPREHRLKASDQPQTPIYGTNQINRTLGASHPPGRYHYRPPQVGTFSTCVGSARHPEPLGPRGNR